MSDPVVPAADTATAPASPTPAADTAPAPASVPDSSGDGGESYNPANDNEAGFAAFRAAKTTPDAPATKSEVVAAAVADATGAPPAAPPIAAEPAPDEGDAKLNRIFNRIASLEKERDEARGSLSRLEQRAARADELEQKFAKLKTAPTEALQELGWTQDTLAEFILKGHEATSPKLTAVEQEQKALKDELAQLKQERAEGERARKIEAFKATIPEQLKDAKSTLPHLSTYFDSDAEMASSVWEVMRSAYQSREKTELTVLEAAKAVEKVLSEQAKRFSRASSKDPASSTTAPAPKQTPAPTLTNKSAPTTPAKTAESDETSPNYAAAAELLRSFRKQ